MYDATQQPFSLPSLIQAVVDPAVFGQLILPMLALGAMAEQCVAQEAGTVLLYQLNLQRSDC